MSVSDPPSVRASNSVERDVEPFAPVPASTPRAASWFAPLDGRLLTPALPATGSGDEYIAVLRPNGAEDAIATINDLAADARSYQCIPMVVFGGGETLARKVASVAGVEGVFVAATGSRDTRSLVVGFDQLMVIERRQRFGVPHAPNVVGGLTNDDVGYPVLAPGTNGFRHLIDVDADRRLPTQPALVPVVNFSIGTTSLDYPSTPNDTVNLATMGASRDQLVVAAAGNAGDGAAQETMSAWAEVPWVLAVGGTADRAGLRLADRSSRGVSGDETSGPDIVAYGASELDESVTGTSFAAPRVSGYALLAVAAILQLRHAWLGAVGGEDAGVQLVGAGFVDIDFASLRRQHVTLPALPIVGSADDIGDVFAQIETSGVGVSVIGSPTLVREILLGAARAVPGCGSHEVGAGFIDDDLLLDHLAGWTAANFVRAFGPQEPQQSPRLPPELAARRVFDRDALAALRDVVNLAMPLWAYDYEQSQLGWLA